jgi:eukaryotic-like serine/threonine-protein kinase
MIPALDVALASGTRLGCYEILSPLGAGGMGEVYRAHDTKLKRQVAIKILPPSVSADPERLSRFQREAEVLAALNHPHIAAVYGLEDSGGVKALVMELVDGEDLAQRLIRGAIPLHDTLPIAKQIAEGLEAAHDRGIIHRDLKPANIKIRSDGTVKVLDFGLAKPVDSRPASGDLSTSPTITTPAMTQAGMVLGTAAYMSPEQARGRPVDKRADIWSFGCVLYEMLTATRPFAGEDVSEVAASVLAREPDWSRLPADLSPALGVLIRRCLQKNPKQRIGDMQDVRLALEGAFDVSQPSGDVSSHNRWSARNLALVIAAVVATTAAVTGLAAWILLRSEGPRSVTRLQMLLPAGQTFYFNGRPIVAISPSGRQVAFQAGLGLWLRSLDELEAKPIPGAEGEARGPFFSSDGRWLGFYAAGELRKVSVTGGAPVALTKAVNPWGATWGADNMILYGQGSKGIWRIPAAGGTPEQVVAVADGELAYRPQLLPGGEWVLFTLRPRGVGSWNRAQIVIQSLATRERVVLIDGGRDARYLPNGYLIYGLNGSLLAVPFDLRARRIAGGAVPLVRDVFDSGTISGAVHFDVAADGSLIYVPRIDTALRLAWVDRNGREETVPGEPRPYRHPRVSPDGTRIAVEIEDPNNTNVWVGDSKRGGFAQLTRGEDIGSDPMWTRDGRHIVFSSVRGPEGLFLQAADGSEAAQHLTDGVNGARATSWTSDGKLVYEELAGDDVLVRSLTDGAAPQQIRLFDAPEYFNERLPMMSPDGRWLAYQSTESGKMEIYVRPFPNVRSARWQISEGGGFAPLWSPDGREVFYRNADSIVAVKIRTEPTFGVVSSGALFNLAGYVLAGTRGVRYDVGRDGRFLFLKSDSPGDSASRQDIVVVANWFEELKRLVPAK